MASLSLMKYISVLLLIPFFSAYAEKIPDYNNPYAPIFFDQKEYSWTDKMKITVIAPSWNTNQNLIDDIGIDSGHYIKISTQTASLEPYRLSETGPNTGMFSGEVILTGFEHDVDGDKKVDTSPRTMGTGPTNGYLETERDSSVTVSFEFADGVVLTKSAPILWKIGEIRFLDDLTSFEKPATIELIDRDLNLNPESIDHALIKVFSDADLAGLEIDAVETSHDSGVFRANLYFALDSHSSGNRLYIKSSDHITAKYDDFTLPKPHSISDHLEITASKKIESENSSKNISINKIITADNVGKQKSELKQNEQIQIVTTIQNQEQFDLPFVCITQIIDDQGVVVNISWIVGALNSEQILDVSQSWNPKKSGNYKVETFVWKTLQQPLALSDPETLDILVN